MQAVVFAMIHDRRRMKSDILKPPPWPTHNLSSSFRALHYLFLHWNRDKNLILIFSSTRNWPIPMFLPDFYGGSAISTREKVSNYNFLHCKVANLKLNHFHKVQPVFNSSVHDIPPERHAQVLMITVHHEWLGQQVMKNPFLAEDYCNHLSFSWSIASFLLSQRPMRTVLDAASLFSIFASNRLPYQHCKYQQEP